MIDVTDSFDEVLVDERGGGSRRWGSTSATCSVSRSNSRDRQTPALVTLLQVTFARATSTRLHERRILEHKVRIRRNGKDSVYKLTLSAVSGTNGETGGVVAVFHDMTRENEIARMKNDFVSSVSHELRTPLASVRAYIEMLIDGEATDDKTRRDFYEIIQGESVRLGD